MGSDLSGAIEYFGEPGHRFSSRVDGVWLGDEFSRRIARDRGPRPHVLRIETELFESECARRTHEDVDASIHRGRRRTGQDAPAFVEPR